MKIVAQKQPSYFEGMEIGDELTIINRDRIKVKFIKSSDESGQIEVELDGQVRRAFEIDYNFENFPTMKERFIQRIRYLFLKDFSIPEFQNADLQDTKLSLLNNLDLGYGLKISKTNPDEVPGIAQEISKEKGEGEEVPTHPSQLLPKGYLPDFVYTIYAKKYKGTAPIGFFAIPFELADEIYDLNSLDDIREFFIDLTEDQIGIPIEKLAKTLQEKFKSTDSTGAFERLDSGHLTAGDILNFYNEKSKTLKPGSVELKNLTHHVNDLIRKLHDGETVTKEDLEESHVQLPPAKNVEHVKDYRRMILLSGLEKNINKVEALFEQRMKTETDEIKIAQIKKEYFALKNSISEMREKLDEATNIQPIINDINKLLEKASDFIKK